jgi:hypothetical protein
MSKENNPMTMCCKILASNYEIIGIWLGSIQAPTQPLSRIGHCRVNTDKRNLVAILAQQEAGTFCQTAITGGCTFPPKRDIQGDYFLRYNVT